MIFAVLVVFCAIAFVVVNYPSYRRKQKCLKDFPSAPGLPILGNALQISSSIDVFNKIKQWSKDLGQTYTINVGPKLIYVTSDVGLMELLMSSNTEIEKAEFYRFHYNWLREGLVTSNGKKWQKRRKAITPTFYFKILEQFVDSFDKHSRTLVDKLKTLTDKPSVEVSHILSLCTLDIICETAMGVHHKSQEKGEIDYVKGIHFLAKNTMTRTFSFIGQNDFLFSFTKDYQTEHKSLKVVHGFVDDVIKARRKELIKKQVINNEDEEIGGKKKIAFLDMLLQTTIDGEPLSDLDIQEEVNTFMFAGHDTTAYTTSFVLYNLAKHPEVQEKIYQEQKTVFKGNMDRCTTYADIGEMKYLEWVIKESMRIFPPVPYVGRQIQKDFDYKGRTFLKDNPIILYIYGNHLNSEHFKDPLVFNPERWSENDTGRSPFAYTPFSAGPRNCIGQKFAMMEMKTITSFIVKNFIIAPSTPDKKLILANEAVLKSMNGIHVSFKKRKGTT